MLLKSEGVHVLSLSDYIDDEITAKCTLNFVMIYVCFTTRLISNILTDTTFLTSAKKQPRTQISALPNPDSFSISNDNKTAGLHD